MQGMGISFHETTKQAETIRGDIKTMRKGRANISAHPAKVEDTSMPLP
jgi:hypothetical protein